MTKTANRFTKKIQATDGTEEESGVVTAVFDKGLEGNSTNLNKQQIKIDDTVYYLGDGISVDTLYDYLGRSVDIVYEDGSKKDDYLNKTYKPEHNARYRR